MAETFNWISPLGASVILFLVIGVLWLFLGVASPLLIKRANPDYLFVSRATDTAYYGASPSQLAQPDSPLAKFRTMMLIVLSGFLFLGGILVISIAWFALRESQAWALIALVLAISPAIGLWIFALRPYVQAGIPLRLGDIPPLIWVPTILILPATILGWLGL